MTSPPLTSLLPFIVSRSLVSGGISLALLSSPDVFHHHVCGGDDARTRDVGAKLDSTIALALLVSRPFTAAAMDAFGRHPVLVLGCMVSGLARISAARNPNSLAAYTMYRVVNACAVQPVMLAAMAFISDVHGGRTSPAYVAFARRLGIALAIVRIAFARLAVRSTLSSVSLMDLAGNLSLIAAAGFAVFTNETIAHRTAFSVKGAVLQSANYFALTPARRAIALVLVLRAFAAYAQTAIGEHRRRAYGWGAEERAVMSMCGDAAEVLVPLLVVEGLGADVGSLEWDLRTSAFALALTAFTPWPRLLYAVPFISLVAPGTRDLNALLAAVKLQGDGDGMVETALSTLDFPVAAAAPLGYARVSQWWGTRAPLVLACGATLVNSEWAVGRAKRICGAAVKAKGGSVITV